MPGPVEYARWVAKYARNTRRIGAVAPSSRFLAREMSRQVGLETAGVVVELGPGTGALTGAILDRVSPACALLLVEVDADFARRLGADGLGRQVRVQHGGAENLGEHLRAAELGPADTVVSGLPLRGLPSDLVDRILREVAHHLAPGGTFVQFSYTPSRKLFRRYFQSVDRTGVPLNVPPAFVFRCRQPAALG